MRRFLQQHGRNERPQVWEIFCNKNAVYTEWGQLGGAMQKTVQKFEAVNTGKSNEKTPGQVAQEFMDRTIKKKMREGYDEVDPQTNKPLAASGSSDVIDFDHLPINLRFFKPQNQMGAGLSKKLAAGEAMALRKRNGMMHVISFGIDSDSPVMYGSNMLPCHKDEPGVPWLERYPLIRRDLLKLSRHLRPNTILLGELVTVSTSGFKDESGQDVDDFNYVGSIVKSLKDRALSEQEAHGHLGYCIWDIAFLDGECLLQTKTAKERFELLMDLVMYQEQDWAYPYLRMPEIVTGHSEEELLDLARKMKWEGWVIVEILSKYLDKAYNFHGKAERPKEVGKLKPTLEGDFIARWDPENGIGAYGKGKKSGGVGAVVLYLWDPDKQVEVPICECGGGLTDKQVAEFADPSRYPTVWQVEFVEWTPKGALWHATFLRERDDKTPEECTIDQRPSTEEDG